MSNYPQGVIVADGLNSGNAGGQHSISGGPSNTLQGDNAMQTGVGEIINTLSTEGSTTQTNATEARQKLLDDVNNIRTARNMSRLSRRNEGVEGVSDDEELMTTDELVVMVNAKGGGPINIPDSDDGAPNNQKGVAKKGLMQGDEEAKWVFSDEMVANNRQQTFSHSIPAQLLAMVKHGVYVPLSFYLIENMERIRLERDLKTYKSMSKPIRIIENSNFIDERELSFAQFTEAYHNFLRCLELSSKPGSTLVLAWEDHFTRSSQDPQMKSDFKAFLHMDIGMRQQFVDNPFSPDVGSEQYRAAFTKAHEKVRRTEAEAVLASMKAELAAARSYAQSLKDVRYHPYGGGNTNQGGNGAGSSKGGSSFHGRNGDGDTGHSFRAKALREPKSRLCLKCGAIDNHISLQCDATTLYKHSDRKTNISIKDRRLVYDADSQPVCIRFNLHNVCPSDHAKHPPHRCTLCLAPFHGAAHCSRL